MVTVQPWRVTGSYFEVCNCDAICPCRRQGTRLGGRSTNGVCDFALSWAIADGHAADTDLSGLAVVLVGRYDDDEPGSPWRVALYVDERADPQQQAALADIFLGRAGGTTFSNFASVIDHVYAIRPARIELDHTPHRERMTAEDFVTAATAKPVISEEAVSCGIPGHDHPGQELLAEHFKVNEPPMSWEVRGRCGFATDFTYTSDE
jgi:hypothetical protein